MNSSMIDFKDIVDPFYIWSKVVVVNAIMVHNDVSTNEDSFWVFPVVGMDVAEDAIEDAIVAIGDPKNPVEDLMDEDGMVVPVVVPADENISMVVVEIVFLDVYFVDPLSGNPIDLEICVPFNSIMDF